MIEEIGVAVGRGRMKAMVCHASGRPDVLKLEEIDRPSIGEDGMLVRVHASSINPVDFFPLSRVGYTARRLSGGLKRKPLVLGVDFAETVESVGPRVADFKPGDEVFGGAKGAFAEYVSVPAAGGVGRTPPRPALDPTAPPPGGALTPPPALRDPRSAWKGQSGLVKRAPRGVGGFAGPNAQA